MSSTRPSLASRYSAASSGVERAAPFRLSVTIASAAPECSASAPLKMPGAEVGVHEAARGQQARHGVGRLERLGQLAGRARAAAQRRAAGGAQHGGQLLPVPGQRGHAVLAVSAQQLVRALARQGHGHVLRGQLREREEAERGEVGQRLVQVPDELLHVVRDRW